MYSTHFQYSRIILTFHDDFNINQVLGLDDS